MPEPGARDAALSVLAGWREKGGGKFEALLHASFTKFGLDARERRLATELAYGTLRNLINLDYVLSHFIKETKKGVSPAVRDILRLAAYQINYLTRIPARAAVDEAVKQAKRVEGAGAGGFVNAVLRSLLREPGRVSYPDPAREPVKNLSLTLSFPEWLASRWLARFGFDEARALMEASNAAPPLTLRANTLRAGRAGLMKLLEDGGYDCAPAAYAPDGIIIRGAANVPELPGYADGLFAVQDEAAQLVSLLVAPKPGERILDACAAPGGKSMHMAALSGGRARITAADIGLDKLRLLQENITRLRIENIRVVRADAAMPPPLPEQKFDAVLLDAPCSALGVIRRRPEIKYARREEDIARMAELQARMLENLAGCVRPGGRLVYCVCSTEPEEAVAVDRLLSSKDWELEDPRPFLPDAAHPLVTGEGYMRTYPHRHGTDGFFAARLARTR